jgi:hypothetical protein
MKRNGTPLLSQSGQMRAESYITKLWDFFWGSLVTGTIPVVVFLSGSILGLIIVALVQAVAVVQSGSEIGLIDTFLVPLIYVLSGVIAAVTLFLVCRWRKCHRILPSWVLAVEILFGLAIGVSFVVIFWRGIASLPP